MPASSLENRLLDKVILDENGCWLFTGSLYENGYGQLWNGKRTEQAHRISYRLYKGPIPVGKEIEHLCRVRRCVNPWHLEAITHRENIHRSRAPMGLNAQKTECNRGHLFDKANTYVTPSGSRQCRICNAAFKRNLRAAA